MINLLPQTERMEVKKEYALRRFVVFLCFSAALLTIGIVMLVPIYADSFVRNKAVTQELEMLASRVKTTDGGLVETDITDLNAKLLLAQPASTSPLMSSALLSEVTSVAGSGITLTAVSYTRLAQDSAQGSRATVSGVSIDRETLLSFVKRLEEQPHIDRVDSPISNLTKNRNLTFVVTFDVSPVTQ